MSGTLLNPSLDVAHRVSNKGLANNVGTPWLVRNTRVWRPSAMISLSTMRKAPFLSGVFLITFSLLIFQIVQTRILSVIAWYYLAFFAISVAMLGMTVGAVWVYLRDERFTPDRLPVILSDFAFATAVAMPASLMVQFCLITTVALSLTT